MTSSTKILILCILSVVGGQVMEGLVQLDKSSIDKVGQLKIEIRLMHARPTAKANQEGSQARQAQYAVDQEGGSVSFPDSSKVRRTSE